MITSIYLDLAFIPFFCNINFILLQMSMLPFVLLSQLYSAVKDRTIVDRELEVCICCFWFKVNWNKCQKMVIPSSSPRWLLSFLFPFPGESLGRKVAKVLERFFFFFLKKVYLGINKKMPKGYNEFIQYIITLISTSTLDRIALVASSLHLRYIIMLI